MKYLFFLCLFAFTFISKSNEVIVQGKIKGFDNKEIRAYIYEDYITFTKSKLASVPIQNGEFHIKFELKKIQQVILTIEDKSTVIFAEGGKVYNINLSYNEELNQTKIYDKFLSVYFPFPTTDDLNQLIATFNNDYDRFFKENYKKIFLNLAKKEVISFVDSILKVEKYKKNPFVNDYVLYTMANLLDISGEPSAKLKENYINNNPIKYNNPEYMNFFRQYFDERFRQFAISSEGAELRKTIMFEKNLDKSISIIQKAEKLASPELAELYLLYGLYEDYTKKTIDQESNKKMLELISQNGKTKENKLIARNILGKLRLMKKGSEAPVFTLVNNKGQKVSLSDFKGKFVYLNFWSTWSIPSIKELKVMKKIYPNYKDKVQFLSINLDEDPEKMREFLQQENYPWPFLHYGDDYELKEKYHVRTVPSYFLIDEEGNLVEAPAPAPVEVENRFSKIK